MESIVQYQSLFDHRHFKYSNQADLATYHCYSSLEPANSPLAILVQQVISNLKKKQGDKQMSYFLQKLVAECLLKQKFLEEKGIKAGKNQIKRLTIEAFTHFLREILGFLSFIGRNTSFHQRLNQLYHANFRILIRWEQAASNSKMETSLSNASNVHKHPAKRVVMTIYTKKAENPAKQVEQSEIDVIEGQQIQKLMKDILKGLNFKDGKDYLSVLKGKAHVFYIIFHQDLMGKGGFGEVTRGESVMLNKEGDLKVQVWAIKSFKKSMNQYNDYNYSISLEREHEILQQIHNLLRLKNHAGKQHIINIQEVINFEGRKYIVYEYCHHNSLKETSKKYKFSKKNIFQIALQLAQVLQLIHYDLIASEQEFLSLAVKFSHDPEIKDDIGVHQNIKNPEQHQKGVIHRDLKLNNILVQDYSEHHIVIKVIDWAFSKRTFTELRINRVSCGTVQYQAPQIQQKKYSSKVDIWAYGAILFELITGKQLVDKSKAKQIKQNIQNHLNAQFENLISPFNSEKAFWLKLLLGTLQKDPDKRWNAIQLLNYLDGYTHYQPIQPQDLIFFASLRQFKSLLFNVFNDCHNYLQNRSKININASIIYSKLMLELAQNLIDIYLQPKINLRKVHIEAARHDIKIEQFKLAMKDIKKIHQTMAQCYKFFEVQLVTSPEKNQIMKCIRFLLDQYQYEKYGRKINML